MPDVDVEGGVGAAGAAPTEEDLEVQGWRKALGLIIGVAVLERAAMFCCLSVARLLHSCQLGSGITCHV